LGHGTENSHKTRLSSGDTIQVSRNIKTVWFQILKDMNSNNIGLLL